MKKIVALIIFVALAVSAFAQTTDDKYKKMWKEVSDAQYKDLPKTALEKVEIIMDMAVADKDDYQQNIDTGLHAVIQQNELESIGRTVERHRKQAISIYEEAIYALNKVRDIYSISCRDVSNVDAAHLSVTDFLEELGDEPSVFYSSVLQDALGEYAEAFIFASMVEGDAIPSYQSLRITPQAWVLGLADSIGEVRRMILAYLMDGRLEDARNLFERMEELVDEILGIDVPDAIVPVRRKQDVARSIIEKTRSDIANAVMLAQMKK